MPESRLSQSLRRIRRINILLRPSCTREHDGCFRVYLFLKSSWRFIRWSRGIVTYFSGVKFDYVWGKTFVSLGDVPFNWVTLSNDGSKVAVHTKFSNYVVIMNALGSVLKAFQYNNGIADVIDYKRNNMIITNDADVYVQH
jgi:hypothetical protein